MKLLIDNTRKYYEAINGGLLKYNSIHTGERKYDGKSFYVVENKRLVAGMNVLLSWDWVRISDLKYENIDQLKMIINKVAKHFAKDALGIRFESSFKEVITDLEQIGFKVKDTYKYSPKSSEYYYLDLDLEDLTEVKEDKNLTENILICDKADIEYDKILKATSNELNKKYKIQACKEETSVVALDGDVFVGGLLAMVFDDYAYIDMLVVDDSYRNRSIGSKLMKKFEENLHEDIVIITLNTTSFQAEKFYNKLGYKTVVTQSNFMRGFEGYAMVKNV